MAFPLAGLASTAAGLTAFQKAAQPVSLLDPQGRSLITFDVVMGETYSRQAQPTSFPVEDGSVISDHIVRAPLTFDMLGIVTDTPLRGRNAQITEAFATTATAVLPPVGVIAGGAAVSLWQSQHAAPSPSTAAYATLCRIAYGDPTKGEGVAPIICTVQTKLQVFENMMIADLQVQRDQEGGSWLQFAVKMVQIVVVQSQTISLSQLDNAALGAVQKTLGEQSASEVDGQYQRGKIVGIRDATSVVGN